MPGQNLPVGAARQGQKNTASLIVPVAIIVFLLTFLLPGLVVLIVYSRLATQLPPQSDFSRILFPLAIGLASASLLTTGLAVLYLIRSFTSPLKHISDLANRISLGEWDVRTHLRRKDEIGALASSLDQLAQNLDENAQSLRSKTSLQSEQFRTLLELVSLITTATNQEEILQGSCNLISSILHFDHVSIYLLDNTRTKVLLEHSTGAKGTTSSLKFGVPISTKPIINWVVSNNHSRIINDRIGEDAHIASTSLNPQMSSAAYLPLTTGNQVIGVLNVQKAQPNSFDTSALTILQAIANQISIGLRNISSLQTSDMDLQSSSLLYRANRQILSAENSRQVFDILDDTLQQTEYVTLRLSIEDAAFRLIMLTDSENEKFDSIPQGIRIPVSRNVHRYTEGEAQIVEDLTAPSDYDNLFSFLTRRGCKSAALLPIARNHIVTEILVLASRNPLPITLALTQPYVNILRTISGMLDRFDVLNALKDRVEDLRTLANVSQAVSTETNLNYLYNTLHEQIEKIIGTNLSFAVALYHEDRNTIEIPYIITKNQQLSLDEYPADEGLTALLFKTRQTILVNTNVDAFAKEHGAKMVGSIAKSWLGVPLIAGGNLIGGIILQDLEQEERFSDHDQSLVDTLAPTIASAIQNAQLFQKMRSTVKDFENEKLLLGTILNNSTDLIYFKDTEGHYIRASKSAAAKFNLPAPEALIGKTDIDLFGEAVGVETFRTEQEILANRKSALNEIEKIIVHDVDIWLRTDKTPVQAPDGTPVGLLVVARDITRDIGEERLALRRNDHSQTAAQIARDTSGATNVFDVLRKTVNLIKSRLDYENVSVFLLDQAGENVVLRESTAISYDSTIPSSLNIAVGSSSIVGQAAARGEALVINDTRHMSGYYPNPILPMSRSEMAIPLQSADKIIGVLDVQSDSLNVFTEDEQSMLHYLADQITVAVTNASLFGQAQEHLARHRLLYQITSAISTTTDINEALNITARGLQTALGGELVGIYLANDANELVLRAVAGYDRLKPGENRLVFGQGIVGQVAETHRPILVKDVNNDPLYISLDPLVRTELAVPILYGGNLMGVLNLESRQAGTFDENDQEILATMGNNLASILSNIELVNRVQRQVERQQQLFDITSKIRRAIDVDTIMKTTTVELSRVLQARRAKIEIMPANLPGVDEEIVSTGPEETVESIASEETSSPDEVTNNEEMTDAE